MRAGAARANTVRSRGGCWWKPNGLRGSVRRRGGAFVEQIGDAQQNRHPAGSNIVSCPREPAPHGAAAWSPSSRPPSHIPQEGRVVRERTIRLSGRGRDGTASPAPTSEGSVRRHCDEGGKKVLVCGCVHEAKWADAAGIDRRLPWISLRDGGFSKPGEAGRERRRQVHRRRWRPVSARMPMDRWRKPPGFRGSTGSPRRFSGRTPTRRGRSG